MNRHAFTLDGGTVWDNKVPHRRDTQTIQVFDFSPRSLRATDRPYPDSLVKLGRSIWKLRNDLYGDAPSYQSDDCKKALGIEESGEMYVFVDECHRTKSGELHKAMKSILPNAMFIGFPEVIHSKFGRV